MYYDIQLPKCKKGSRHVETTIMTANDWNFSQELNESRRTNEMNSREDYYFGSPQKPSKQKFGDVDHGWPLNIMHLTLQIYGNTRIERRGLVSISWASRSHGSAWILWDQDCKNGQTGHQLIRRPPSTPPCKCWGGANRWSQTNSKKTLRAALARMLPQSGRTLPLSGLINGQCPYHTGPHVAKTPRPLHCCWTWGYLRYRSAFWRT